MPVTTKYKGHTFNDPAIIAAWYQKSTPHPLALVAWLKRDTGKPRLIGMLHTFKTSNRAVTPMQESCMCNTLIEQLP